MITATGKRLRLLLVLLLTAGALAVVPTTASAHVGGFPSVGTDFGDPGPSQVTVLEDGDHTIYHPTVMGEGGVHHPVILWGNGTGANPSNYDGLLRHFASHGFIVAAADTPNAGSGAEMIAGFEKLAAWNTEEGNTFFGMVNTDDAGATGHSQGGGGAINAGAHPNVSTIFPLQPGGGNVGNVTGTAFFLAGENDTVISPASVQRKFEAASGLPAAYAVAAGADHFAPARDGGAYRYAATAWARMQLMADDNAHQVFQGADCILCGSDEWTSFETNPAFDADHHGGPGDGGHEHPDGEEPGDGHEHPDGEEPGDGHEHPGDGCEPGAPAMSASSTSPAFSSFIQRLLQRLRGGIDRPDTPTPTTVPAPGAPCEPGDGHEHPDGEEPGHGHGEEPGHGHGGHEPPEGCEVKPYDATLPVDLCGLADVTPEQQAWAEDLVTRTIERLPQWADVRTAEAAGFRSIGDGMHWINWAWIDDEHTFNPDRPESLVYERGRLAAAMYMLPTGTTLENAPNPAGDLIQWHVHNDLCYNADYRTGATAPRLSMPARPDGTCRPGSYMGPRTPMVHVWIRPHQCGAFSALEGPGGGQIAEGEEVSCLDHGDHGH